MLSISGLKLERMLTMIYKKKRNFKIENINNVFYSIQEFQTDKPPSYIGINSNVKSDIFNGLAQRDTIQKEMVVMDLGNYLKQTCLVSKLKKKIT